MAASVPNDPLTFLAEAAAQQHELFMAWVNAGFTRAEALQMIIAIMTEGMSQTSEQASGEESADE